MSPEDKDLDVDLEHPFSHPPSPEAAIDEKNDGNVSEHGEEEYEISMEGEGKIKHKWKPIDSESNHPNKCQMDAMDKAKAIAEGQTRAQLEVITKTLHACTEHEKIKQKTTLEIRHLEIEAEE